VSCFFCPRTRKLWTSSALLRAFIYHFDRCYRLKPVSFRYKAEIDPSRPPSVGLIAEEVENVQSDLVLRDNEGTPYSALYDQ